MVTTTTNVYGATGAIVEIYCLSTDTKPTNVANGSKCIETDTSTLYIFDEENKVWRAWE